jgi:hypothetical protein
MLPLWHIPMAEYIIILIIMNELLFSYASFRHSRDKRPPKSIKEIFC